jgi:GMP synthase (glutamine-hydrolysing)
VLGALPGSFTAFHWHGDAFTLPPDGVPLAASAMTPLQAFRSGARSWGIQFHFETDEQVLDAMLRSGGAELAQAGVDAAAIRRHAARALPDLRRLALGVFSRWAALL